MITRILPLIAGTVLTGLGQELPPSVVNDGERPPELAALVLAAVSKRTDIVFEADDSPPLHPRRLQLHLEDASREDLGVRSGNAYAALLMDDHDRGIRTLGQSLLDTRTAADLVAILAPGVTREAERRIRSQGWRIRRLAVDGVGGDDQLGMDSSASMSVLAHASAWALTEYKRVVLLEDNMLVVENIDDLFLCSGICAAMQQAEVISTALVVLEPDLESYRQMSQAVGTIYSFSNDFQGFLNSYLAGFEACALFDLENSSLQDPSTDPSRGRDALLLDHSCHRLPTRYNGDLSLVMLNGGLGMVRTKNRMPKEWWRQRNARVVQFGFAGLRPWMWFVSPFLPFVSSWESAHFRAKPTDPMPSMLWVMFVWLSFVGAVRVGRSMLAPMAADGSWWSKPKTPTKASGSARWGFDWWHRSFSWDKRRRCFSASSYNPRGLLWSLVHLAVGYASLTCAVFVGVRQVPPTSSVWMSWMIFIMWTSTIFGLLWSLYLWVISRQVQLAFRSVAIGNGGLDFGANGTLVSAPGAGVGIDPVKAKTIDVVGGGGAGAGVLKVGAVAPPSPWRESVRSLVLFAAVLGFLPAWKPLSGASTLLTLLGPALLALLALFLGLTVQMVRLPVLWCDYFKFLSLMERDGLCT